jgi:hypothetical protein
MKNNSMNAPKILPWIARKAGISDELALKLWRRALSEAEYLTGKAEGSEYWGTGRRTLPVDRRRRSRHPGLQPDPGPAPVLDVASADPDVPALANGGAEHLQLLAEHLGKNVRAKKSSVTGRR